MWYNKLVSALITEWWTSVCLSESGPRYPLSNIRGYFFDLVYINLLLIIGEYIYNQLLITTTMDDNFSIQKCPNCNGYGTIGRDRLKCPTCKGSGVIVIDNMTGKLIINDDDGNKNNTH